MVRPGVVSAGSRCTGTMGTLMDPFEKLLTDLVDHMKAEWQSFDDWTSPLGELTAEAAAVLQFYREQHLPKPIPFPHWGDTWRHRP